MEMKWIQWCYSITTVHLISSIKNVQGFNKIEDKEITYSPFMLLSSNQTRIEAKFKTLMLNKQSPKPTKDEEYEWKQGENWNKEPTYLTSFKRMKGWWMISQNPKGRWRDSKKKSSFKGRSWRMRWSKEEGRRGFKGPKWQKKPSNLWPGKPYMAVLCLSARFLQYCATIHYLQYFNYSTTNNSKTQGHSHGYVQPPYGRVPLSHGHVSPCVPFCQFTIVPCYNTFTTIPLLQYFSYNMQNTRKTHERVTARVAPGNVTWPHTRACKY